MTFYIDLNDYSGGPHWLSAKGKVNRDKIRSKNRAKYLATKVYAKKPARPETMARLERVVARAKNQGLERAKTSTGDAGSREPGFYSKASRWPRR